MSTHSVSFTWGTLDFDYDYSPPEPEVRYLPDGSGDPGCPASVELTRVMFTPTDGAAVDLTPMLNEELFSARFLDSVEEAIHEAKASDYITSMEARAHRERDYRE
jgi:hypothetical protein